MLICDQTRKIEGKVSPSRENFTALESKYAAMCLALKGDAKAQPDQQVAWAFPGHPASISTESPSGGTWAHTPLVSKDSPALVMNELSDHHRTRLLAMEPHRNAYYAEFFAKLPTAACVAEDCKTCTLFPSVCQGFNSDINGPEFKDSMDALIFLTPDVHSVSESADAVKVALQSMSLRRQDDAPIMQMAIPEGQRVATAITMILKVTRVQQCTAAVVATWISAESKTHTSVVDGFGRCSPLLLHFPI